MIKREFENRKVAEAFAKKHGGEIQVINNAFGKTVYVVIIR